MGERLTRADLPALKELILSYQQWRRATGKPLSTFWQEKLRAGLEADGIVKPKSPVAPAPAGERHT